jgi:hypothetical protein
MDLQTHGAKKYPDSALLKSSAGLGWSTIAAELRSHGVSSTPVIVPQHTEVILAVAGNDKGLIAEPAPVNSKSTHRRPEAFHWLPLPWEIKRLRSLPQFRQCYTYTCQRRYFGG